MLANLDRYMHKNETRSLSLTNYKNKLKMDALNLKPETEITRKHRVNTSRQWAMWAMILQTGPQKLRQQK